MAHDLNAEQTLEWIKSELVNSENSTNEELVKYFMDNGLTKESAMLAIWQREEALKNPLSFHLNPEGLVV